MLTPAILTKARGAVSFALSILVVATLMGIPDICRAETKKPTQEQIDAAAKCDATYLTCRKTCEDVKETSKVFPKIKACYARCEKAYKACLKKAMAREKVAPDQAIDPSGVAP